MRDALQKMHDMFQAIMKLPDGERAFFAAYLQQECYLCPPADVDFEPASTMNLVAIYDQYGSTSSLTFIRDLLSWCYDNDNDDSTHEVCSFLCDLRFNAPDIQAVLLKGIWDTQKSNLLRERFFWCFRGHFRAAAVQFFTQDFSCYLEENPNNDGLITPLIDHIYHTMRGHPDLPRVEDVAYRYLIEHPENIYALHSEALLKRLGISKQQHESM